MSESLFTFQELEQVLRILETAPEQGSFKVKANGVELSVTRGGATGPTPQAAQPAAQTPPPPAAQPAQPTQPVPPPQTATQPEQAEPEPAAAQPAPNAPETTAMPPVGSGYTVESPMTGVFYRQPSPGADPFVVEGQRVEAGEVLAIIEVMKLMNRLTSPVSGIVTQIPVQNEQLVERGAPLFVIQEEGAES